MVSVQDLSSFPAPAEVPVCEKNGRLCTIPIREVTGNSYVLEFYPEINVNREMFSTSGGRCVDQWRSVMIPVNEHLFKRITRTFFESGFTEALNEARNPQVATGNHIIISSVAEYIYRTLEFVKKLKIMIMPHLKEEGIASIAKYSEIRDWSKSYVRCLVWHPNCFKIAVASSDDVIRVYTDEPAVVPILKCTEQKNITSMAWRPFSAGEIAVGCEFGVCLWTMDNNLHISRPLSQAALLKHPNHSPVISVEWSPNGCLLATSSINDPDILIWDVDQSQSTSLKRVGPPCSLLKWSPDGSYLFSATVGNVFRVWTTNNWTAERWTIPHGYIQSATWSPCGSFFLFVTSQESVLYKLQFVEEQLFANSTISKHALPMADLSKVNLGCREVGGLPQAISWDPNGHYLAIIFKGSPCVAIFGTNINKYSLNLSPSCFLTGIGTEYPSHISFQSKNRKNTDSVLTIGWSSGRIQYFPFVNNI